MIPLVHDLPDEAVVVFDGDPVGARKAHRFARGARTVVVSPEFAGRDFGGAERVRTAPAPDEVPDWVERFAPALVIVATDDGAMNDAVVAAARDAGALVNRADRSGERDAGSVVVPATVGDGDVSVAITTGGASPALSKHLRERVEVELEGAGEMAALIAEPRTELKASDRPPTERRDAIRTVVRSPSVWKILCTGDANPRQEIARVIRDTQRGDSWEIQASSPV